MKSIVCWTVFGGLCLPALLWAGTPAERIACGDVGGSNCNASIPDDTVGGVVSSLTVPASVCADSQSLESLSVQVTAYHNWVGDLTFTLEHVPTGTSVVLLEGSADHETSCSGDDLDLVFQDGAQEPSCSLSRPTYNGTASANTALSVFQGENPAGSWTLTVDDLDVSPPSPDALGGWALDVVCTLPVASLPPSGQNRLQFLLIGLGSVFLGWRLRRRFSAP